MKQPIVNCPQCGRVIVWDPTNRYRPFCSERCKMIDLGKWADEEFRVEVPGDEQQEFTSPTYQA